MKSAPCRTHAGICVDIATSFLHDGHETVFSFDNMAVSSDAEHLEIESWSLYGITVLVIIARM